MEHGPPYCQIPKFPAQRGGGGGHIATGQLVDVVSVSMCVVDGESSILPQHTPTLVIYRVCHSSVGESDFVRFSGSRFQYI